MRRALPTLVAVLASLALLFVAVALGSAATPPAPLLEQVRDTLVSRYYRPVPPSILGQPTVDELLAALKDPYTEYLAPADARALRLREQGRYSGIGATVTARARGLVVTSVPPGPARIAGIRPGDVIVTIGGVPTAELSPGEAVSRIVGARGTAVTLGIRRHDRVLSVRIVRADVVVPSVRTALVVRYGRKIGVLRVRLFAAGTAARLRDAALELQARGVTGYVLDLRSNPGGLLDEAVGVASLFLEGEVVTTISGAHEPARVLRADGEATLPRLPVVVLVNRYSASSSEVVAAALQENHRAYVVGEPTFGKALVQDVEPLEGGGALKLTVARYLTPRGRDISGAGVIPDVLAPGEALPAAISVLPVP
jgi:carboxyl-terminal processing protease